MAKFPRMVNNDKTKQEKINFGDDFPEGKTSQTKRPLKLNPLKVEKGFVPPRTDYDVVFKENLSIISDLRFRIRKKSVKSNILFYASVLSFIALASLILFIIYETRYIQSFEILGIISRGTLCTAILLCMFFFFRASERIEDKIDHLTDRIVWARGRISSMRHAYIENDTETVSKIDAELGNPNINGLKDERPTKHFFSFFNRISRPS
ncbi:MAG: hypothetical protein AB7P01_13710 [Bacteroidia bacterium]